MKLLKLLILLLISFSLFTCQDTDDIGNLTTARVWRFGSCFVNGSGVPSSGTVTFDQNTGTFDMFYFVNGAITTKNGPFEFTETLDEVLIERDSSTLVWERVVNKKNEQEFHFKETFDQIEYDIVFDLIPQR